MNCHFINEHLIEYLENELDQSSTMEFKSHLTDCQSCQELVTEVKLTYGLASTTQELQISENFVDQTVSRLTKKEAKVIPMFYQILKPIAVAASIGLGILIGNGELSVLDGDLNYTEEESYVLSVATPSEYSVWQTLNEEYGNED